MVKAQVRSGGRGKAGLVRPAEDAAVAGAIASDLIGTLRSDDAPEVEALLIERQLGVADEFYLAIRIDDVLGCPVVLASLSGGIDVEAGDTIVAEAVVDVLVGFRRHEAVDLWLRAGLRGRRLRAAADFATTVWSAFVATDADLIEINPVIVDDRGDFWAADAKVTISDNAMYRQPILQETWLSEPGTQFERRARALGINSYLDLEGDTLLFCSGAGFSMCCFDAITRGGLRPANFLDMGGATDRTTRTKTAELLLEKAARASEVTGILIAMVLTMQPLENSVEAFVEAFKERPPDVRAAAWFHAALASTERMSVAEARAALESVGIRTCDTIDEAVAYLAAKDQVSA
jgi:succinyl-CoA synthetase beta subunit